MRRMENCFRSIFFCGFTMSFGFCCCSLQLSVFYVILECLAMNGIEEWCIAERYRTKLWYSRCDDLKHVWISVVCDTGFVLWPTNPFRTKGKIAISSLSDSLSNWIAKTSQTSNNKDFNYVCRIISPFTTMFYINGVSTVAMVIYPRCKPKKKTKYSISKYNSDKSILFSISLITIIVYRTVYNTTHTNSRHTNACSTSERDALR